MGTTAAPSLPKTACQLVASDGEQRCGLGSTSPADLCMGTAVGVISEGCCDGPIWDINERRTAAAAEGGGAGSIRGPGRAPAPDHATGGRGGEPEGDGQQLAEADAGSSSAARCIRREGNSTHELGASSAPPKGSNAACEPRQGTYRSVAAAELLVSASRQL